MCVPPYEPSWEPLKAYVTFFWSGDTSHIHLRSVHVQASAPRAPALSLPGPFQQGVQGHLTEERAQRSNQTRCSFGAAPSVNLGTYMHTSRRNRKLAAAAATLERAGGLHETTGKGQRT